MRKEAALLTLALTAAMPASHAADLQIAIRQAGADKGWLYFALFDKKSFLQKPLATARSAPGEAAAVFKELPPGAYAVSVFQDANANGNLDRNIVGAPIEPFGFSNDAIGVMGPPSFDKAAIQIGAENQTIVINLR